MFRHQSYGIGLDKDKTRAFAGYIWRHSQQNGFIKDVWGPWCCAIIKADGIVVVSDRWHQSKAIWFIYVRALIQMCRWVIHNKMALQLIEVEWQIHIDWPITASNNCLSSVHCQAQKQCWLYVKNVIYKMAWYNLVNIGSVNGLLPDGIKPLPKTMLTNHQ